MKILGIGTDIVECVRIGRMIEQHGELFLRRVYTDREIRYCQARKFATEHFAGHWAAKEAVLKAIGARRGSGVSGADLEVRIESGGPPRVHVRGPARDVVVALGVADVMVSIAHCRTYATAYAMALAPS